MMRAVAFSPEAVREAFDAAPGRSRTQKMRNAAAALGCSLGTVARNLKGHVGASLTRSPGGPGHVGARAFILPLDHPAVTGKRTLFPTTVREVGKEWLLKAGKHSAKIGGEVRKGPWKGFPIYTLTLEERATCPESCRHWGSCYGNHTHLARRWRHGPDLEWRLRREVAALELEHGAGFAVRLHSLGDFYSVGYVRMWRDLLEKHPALHVFGYTARVDCEIAHEVAMLVRDYWRHANPPRFAVRFSNAPIMRYSTVTIEGPLQRPPDAVVCPAQWTPSGKKSDCCGTCALCWDTAKRVAFLQH